MQRLFRELKRRNVYRVAATYAAVAFVTLQAARLIFPATTLEGLYDKLVVLAFVGFPIALVIAWAFELTPEGVRRTTEESGEEEARTSMSPEEQRTQSRLAMKALVALGLVGAAVAGGWYLTGGGGPSLPDPVVPRVEGLDSTRVAVFPWAVRSGEGLSDWSAGMVELMGRSLDGAGSLQAVDPNTLLSRLETEPEEGIHADSARRIAARFGAGRYVLGSIYELGDSLRLSATWYRTDGDELGSADVTGAGEGDIQGMVNVLARSAIVDLTGGEAQRRERLAAQTTSSIEALKAYLAGQRAFRDRNMSAAIRAFSDAVERDSTFALAHYRLSFALGWRGRDPRLVHRAAQRAADLSDDLPDRDRRFLRAYDAYNRGDADRAERLYRLILQSHADDTEAWYLLGETLFHYNPVRGRPVTESRVPFRRAMRLDPSFDIPLGHLGHLALLERDTARLDSLLASFEEDLGYGFRAILQVVREGGNPEKVESAFRPLLAREPGTALIGVHGLAIWDEAAALEAVGPWTEPNRPDEVRASALLMQADLLAARGKLEAARAKVRTIAPLDSAAYWVGRSQLAALPFLAATESVTRERRDARQGLQVWNADQVPDRLVTVYLSPREVYPAGRLYLLGLLQAQAGETVEALRTADRLETLEPSLLASSGPVDLARSIRAEVSRQRDRPERALAQLEAIENHVSALLLLQRLHSSARERYLRAQLLAEQGRPEEALRWFGSITGLSWGERPYLGPARLGEARALEELGRTEQAIQQYRRFIELWQDADSILQPKVAKARQAVIRLRDETATSPPADSVSDTR